MSSLAAAVLIGLAAVINLLLKSSGRAPWVLADSYTHFYVAQEMRRRRSWRIRLNRFLYDAEVPDRLDYPPCFGILLASLLGDGQAGRRVWLARWFPGLLDTMALLTAVACVRWLGGDVLAMVVAAFIWLLSPCTYAQTVALSGRPLGLLIATVLFTSLAHLSFEWTWAALLVALIAGALLNLANRLAVQAWLFLTVALCLAERSLWPSLVLVGAGALAWMLSLGDARKIQAGHLRHMRRLRRLMPRKRWHQLARFSVRRGAAPPRRGWRLLVRVVGAVDLPFLWMVPLAAFLSQPGFAATESRPQLLLWIGCMAVCGIFIDLVPALRFIGEGFRYYEFSIVPIALVVSQSLTVGGAPPAVLLVAAVGGSLVSALQIRRNMRASHFEGTKRDERAVVLAGRLRTGEIDRLLVLPLQYAPLVTVEAGKSTLMMLGEIGADLSEDFYPVMQQPPAEFARRFDLQGVFLDRRYVEASELGLSLQLVDAEGPFEVHALVPATLKAEVQESR